MNLMLASGTLNLITFLVIASFIILGSISLRRHTRKIDPSIPYEADLTEEGRKAQAFERTTIED
ncbi:hypothetical protein ACTQ49_04585 [Luteococcus sp. Sow4_B9]|uniref:hypothetical protein n=1 Tax=Luteococcus sp. Sow4_B9 TaxID=3438792 RepID=UPI003F9DB5BE